MLSAEQFQGPVLSVQPRGLFESSRRGLSGGNREIEKMAVLSALGVRSLREYYAGDDLRRIDWKMTAKHNKLFVREYAGIMNLPPLIIVDLPWREAPYPGDEFARMVAAVAGQVEHSTTMNHYSTVLLISRTKHPPCNSRRKRPAAFPVRTPGMDAPGRTHIPFLSHDRPLRPPPPDPCT